jgi:hypothetical protein
MTPFAAALQVRLFISSALLARDDVINLSARHDTNASPDARAILQLDAITQRIAPQDNLAQSLPHSIIATRA